MTVFEKLYASEINFAVSCFWNAGYEVMLGDTLNGFVDEDVVRTWGEVECWLRNKAIEHYPTSLFAREAL